MTGTIKIYLRIMFPSCIKKSQTKQNTGKKTIKSKSKKSEKKRILKKMETCITIQRENGNINVLKHLIDKFFELDDDRKTIYFHRKKLITRFSYAFFFFVIFNNRWYISKRCNGN
jgi:hypothetical protein